MALGANLMLLSMRSSCCAVPQHAPVRGDCVFKQDAALCYDRACLFGECYLRVSLKHLGHDTQLHKVVSVYVNKACVSSS